MNASYNFDNARNANRHYQSEMKIITVDKMDVEENEDVHLEMRTQHSDDASCMEESQS